MTSSASQPYDVDWRYIEKVDRTLTAGEYLQERINAIPDVVNNTYDKSADKALSANMWRMLQNQINELKTPWKFLSNWDCETWLATDMLPDNPYVYWNWDYFIVSNVSETTNYKPNGLMYTDWSASTTLETWTVQVNDTYMYNWNEWIHTPASISIAVDTELSNSSTNPVENRAVTEAINWKLAKMIEVTVNTAYWTAAKVWSTSWWWYTPTRWDLLLVTFVKWCQASSPTLNIDWSWAKGIRIWNSTVNGTTFDLWNTSNSNVRVLMYYDWTYYKVWCTTNTTYSALSAADAKTWTSTTSRAITASVLKTAIKYHAVDDTAYWSSWSWKTDIAPSQNVVYDAIVNNAPTKAQLLITSLSNWDATADIDKWHLTSGTLVTITLDDDFTGELNNINIDWMNSIAVMPRGIAIRDWMMWIFTISSENWEELYIVPNSDTWWWSAPADVYTKTEADNKFLAQNYVHTYSISSNNIPVIEKVNGFLYTTTGSPLTSNSAEIRSASTFCTIRYDVSQLVGQSIHISTKWQSNSKSRDIGIIYFITGENTIIQKTVYDDYCHTANVPFDVEEDMVVPATATELWVDSTKARMPEPICVLNNPVVQSVSKSLMSILDDYMNEVVVDNNNTLSTIPLSEKIEQATQKTINLLFIGNSLTQDGVSYLPMILKTIAPELNFNIWIWYDGGYTLSQILNKWNNNSNATIVSNANNVTSWTNYNNSKTIEFILSQAKFDIVILEEYLTFMDSYGADELAVFENVVNYLRSHMDYSFKLAFLFHMVHLTQERQAGDIDIDERFQFMKTATQTIYDNEPISSIIPLGFASYRASKTELNSLGDVGGLSPDYTHAQEGLPCQLLAWTTATWLFDQLGMTKGILNDQTRINSNNYDSINVPWPNLGTGIVVGTEAQYKLSQKVAIQAVKECNDTFKFTIPTIGNN